MKAKDLARRRLLQRELKRSLRTGRVLRPARIRRLSPQPLSRRLRRLLRRP